ncbi:hypothetical protein A2U01_0056919, partial [Trifolium medium]|nr:hypothetical protein [Trifolium medium]
PSTPAAEDSGGPSEKELCLKLIK